MRQCDKDYLNRLSELGCIACLIDGIAGTPCEIHHPRAGTGMGKKAPHHDAIPLCPAHHRGTDHPRTPSIHLAKKAFIARYGTEAELLRRIRELLGLSRHPAPRRFERDHAEATEGARKAEDGGNEPDGGEIR